MLLHCKFNKDFQTCWRQFFEIKGFVHERKTLSPLFRNTVIENYPIWLKPPYFHKVLLKNVYGYFQTETNTWCVSQKLFYNHELRGYCVKEIWKTFLCYFWARAEGQTFTYGTLDDILQRAERDLDKPGRDALLDLSWRDKAVKRYNRSKSKEGKSSGLLKCTLPLPLAAFSDSKLFLIGFVQSSPLQRSRLSPYFSLNRIRFSCSFFFSYNMKRWLFFS